MGLSTLPEDSIAAEVEFPDMAVEDLSMDSGSAPFRYTGKMVNTLRILSEREVIEILERYIEELEMSQESTVRLEMGGKLDLTGSTNIHENDIEKPED